MQMKLDLMLTRAKVDRRRVETGLTHRQMSPALYQRNLREDPSPPRARSKRHPQNWLLTSACGQVQGYLPLKLEPLARRSFSILKASIIWDNSLPDTSPLERSERSLAFKILLASLRGSGEAAGLNSKGVAGAGVSVG
jgi:hypothetical protein